MLLFWGLEVCANARQKARMTTSGSSRVTGTELNQGFFVWSRRSLFKFVFLPLIKLMTDKFFVEKRSRKEKDFNRFFFYL